MERFSADHIRQQPEFQFLLYREKSQVIQTCVEDGEIKLRIGHQPSPAKRDKARTPPRPTSGHNSTKSGASSTVSDAAVHRSTIARAQSASAADRPSADKSKTRQRKLGVVAGQIGEPPFEDRCVQDHSSVSRRSVVSSRFDGTERRKGYEEHRHTHDDSKDGNKVGTNHEKNHSNFCKIKGDTEISDEAQNEASNHLRQSRDIAERSKETNNHCDTTATPPNNRNIANGEHANFPTNQNTELSPTVGERRADEDRKLIKAFSTSIRLTPEETTAEQLTNKTSKSDPRKSGGITERSADTASKHVTERGDYCELFTDPEKQATRNNNITERKSCGITEQGRPFHAIDEDEKETKLTDHSTNDQGTTLHADGHTDGETQNGRHVPGKAKGVDKSRAEASSSLDHSSGMCAQNIDGCANPVRESVNGLNNSPCGHQHADQEVPPKVDKAVKKENVLSKVSTVKRNERTKPRVKASNTSRSAAKQQTPRENSSVRSNKAQGKIQKVRRKNELMPSSKKKSSEVTKLEKGKENEVETQMTRPIYLPPKTSAGHLDSTLCSLSTGQPEVSKTQQEDRRLECISDDKREKVHSAISGVLPDTSDGENSSHLIGSQQYVSRSFETPVTDANARANARIIDPASCQIDASHSAANDCVSIHRKQGAQINQSGEDRYSMAGMADTRAEDDNLDSESLSEYPRPVTRVDVRESPRNNNNNISKTDHNKRSDATENNQVKTSKGIKIGSVVATSAKETVSDATSAQIDSHLLRTKVNLDRSERELKESHRVREGKIDESVSSNRAAHSPSKSNKTPRGMTVDPSQEMEVTSDHGKDDYATLTGFTIPAIVVDKASTIGDASNYSDDVDAVSIDAEDYLTSTQSGKSGNQDSSLAQSFKQKVHNWYQLADPHVNAEWKLNVPPNPELQEENVSSTPYPQSSQHVLKSRLENTHIYNSSAALELSGLRTTLTPSPYNVEFNANTSHGPRSPHTDISIYAVSKPRASPHKSRHSPRPSTTDCTFQGRRSSTVSKTLTPKCTGTHRAPQLSEGAQPRSAISSRRSSVNSVHWDQAVTDPLALNRQTSWEGNRSEPPTHPAPRRRHSTALGIRHEKLLDMADPAIIAQLSSASDPSMGGGVESSPDFRRHSMGVALEDPTGERRLSTASALSGVPSQRSSLLNQEELDAAELARQASQYDPRVEKSERYNHQRENGTFNQACQWLTPVRRGLRTLQVQYSQTNTTHNDSLIFAHLLRAAHVKNAAVEDAVYSTERRLYTRRHTDVPHATTFFDLPPESDHPTSPNTNTPGGQGQKASQTADGRRTSSASAGSKGYRTVAKKKKERRERIKKKNEELELGYTPRAQSLRQLGPEDMQAILHQCRHLRVSPHLQQHLYDDTTTTTGIVAVLSPLVEEQQQIDTGTQAQAKATCAAAPAAATLS